MKDKTIDKKLISDYGRVLKKGSSRTIVDFNDYLQINFNFQLHNINDLVREFNGVMPPNRISHYILAFVKKGRGKKIIGNYSFNIHPNMGMVFPKRIIHSTDKWSEDTEGYMLTFNESLFEDTGFPVTYLKLPGLFRLSVKPYRILDDSMARMAHSLFRDMQKIKDHTEPHFRKILILKLSELIFLYQAAFNVTEGNKKESGTVFDKFVELLELNYMKNRSVNFYAGTLAVNPNHLNKIVHANTGFSAKYYIQNRIFQEAKYLLSATGIPVKEIAFSLGFDDYSYFCRQFRQITKHTPRQYRKSNI